MKQRQKDQNKEPNEGLLFEKLNKAFTLVKLIKGKRKMTLIHKRQVKWEVSINANDIQRTRK